MKKILSFFVGILFATMSFAQVDEVTLTVVGTGSDEEKATSQAFRNAIEQAFGVFVSSNTRLINDALQEDMVNISNGYVKRYEKLAVTSGQQGKVCVSINATVSVNKLISYTNSKGARAEFAGDTYAANVKLMKLKASSAKKAMDIIIEQLDYFKDLMFDFELDLNDPYLREDKYWFDGTVYIYSNAYTTNFLKLFISTLKAIRISSEEAKQFERAGIETDYYEMVRDLFGDGSIVIYPCKMFSYREKISTLIGKSMFRYTISEIQNPTNSYYWSGATSSYSSYTKRGPHIYPVEGYRSRWESTESDSGWWSELGAGYIIPWRHYTFDYIIKEDLRYRSYTIQKYMIEEIKIPLQLSSKDMRKVQGGTFNGETYRIQYGKQPLVASVGVTMFIPQSRMDSFKGFELIGKSVNGPNLPDDKASYSVDLESKSQRIKFYHKTSTPNYNPRSSGSSTRSYTPSSSSSYSRSSSSSSYSSGSRGSSSYGGHSPTPNYNSGSSGSSTRSYTPSSSSSYSRSSSSSSYSSGSRGSSSYGGHSPTPNYTPKSSGSSTRSYTPSSSSSSSYSSGSRGSSSYGGHSLSGSGRR